MKIESISNLASFYLKKSAYSLDQRLQQLSKIPSFAARIKFCNENFNKITSGSARVIYQYDNDYVIKLAKNEKGLAQNNTESDGFLQQNYDIITKAIDSDPDDKWILVEKASKISPSVFKQKLGFSLQELYSYLQHRFNNNTWLPKPANWDFIDNSEFVQEMTDMMSNFIMPPGDYGRINSYGLVKDRVVIVDYGLTSDIYERYYKR